MNDRRLQQAIDLHRSGQLDPAWQTYNVLLQDNPAHADAWHLSGLVAAQRGDLLDGRRRIEQAIRIDGSQAVFFMNLARLLRQLGEIDAAIGAYDRSLVLAPAQPEALLELATLVGARGQHGAAITLFERALVLQPERRDLRIALAHHRLHAGQTDAAITTLQEILKRNPGDADVIAAIGQSMIRQQRFDEAIERYRQALALNPDCALAEDGLVAVCTRLARTSEALAVIERKLARCPDDARAHSQRLFLLNYLPDLSPAEVARAHSEWGTRLVELSRRTAACTALPPALASPSAAQRRLRVGYVSADFKQHPVAVFVEPVLAGHDRTAFEVFCYSSTVNPDAVTRHLASLGVVWRDIAGLDDARVCDLVAADRIDLLVDLSGHTADNRLGVFARRAAPVQITWLGYPHSTGLPNMDFRLCDAITDPQGSADTLASEQLLRLPDCFLCYRPAMPPTGEPDDVVPPAALGRPLTFGSFNHIAKISAPTLAAWTQLLHALPSARLFLKAHGIGAPSVATRLLADFAAAGIGPERLVLSGATPDHADHLATYRQIDIALDTFPYNGTTTTCDALWMGVPVVTLTGDRHAARVGSSLLSAAGHPELVARNVADYVELARLLAGDPPRLAALHRHLRHDLMRSPLTDAKGFVARLETAYRLAWQQGTAPAGR